MLTQSQSHLKGTLHDTRPKPWVTPFDWLKIAPSSTTQHPPVLCWLAALWPVFALACQPFRVLPSNTGMRPSGAGWADKLRAETARTSHEQVNQWVLSGCGLQWNLPGSVNHNAEGCFAPVKLGGGNISSALGGGVPCEPLKTG